MKANTSRCHSRQQSPEQGALCLITESTGVVNSASASCSAGLLAVDSKGIVPVLPTGNSESLPSTDSMRITQRTGFRGIKMNLRHKLFGPSISQFASEFAIYRGFVLSQLFVYFARTGALPQDHIDFADVLPFCILQYN